MVDQPGAVDGQPRDETRREIRFATVMYGGVSLAIYMNGVTQELLRLVRSSAPEYAAGETPSETGNALLGASQLKGTESVYRKIAQHLGERGEWDPHKLRDAAPSDPIRTRFVIDVLSGTSAGGINAIFLAKALAFGEDIDAIGQLWLDQGDFSLLLNDRRSWSLKHPESLLDSAYMYKQLLAAFEAMDKTQRALAGKVPQLGRDIDLFVTTTDIKGLPLALRLSDDVVEERRHRNVFHLRYVDGRNGEKSNDFAKSFNPFLAFIARCTSSFPIAFEPMRLTDITGSIAKEWQRFFPAYTGVSDERSNINDPGGIGADNLGGTPWPTNTSIPLPQRAFGDGGFLDNKPFEYAINAIAQRRSSVAVERRLLYLEPVPEHAELDAPTQERPNAFESLSAALTLARYETIRNDLQRILVHNRTVERVDRITGGIDDDLRIEDKDVTQRREREAEAATSLPVASIPQALDPEAAALLYARQDIRDGIGANGIAFGGYHRLLVSALTDELTEYVARAGGFNEDSDSFEALRYLLGAWRSAYYKPILDQPKHPPVNPTPGSMAESENAFLLRYDISYRIRRLSFVLRRLDQLLGGGQVALDLLSRRGVKFEQTAANKQDFEALLRVVREKLASCLTTLRRHRFDLLSRDKEINPISTAVKGLQIDKTFLSEHLGKGNASDRRQAAIDIVVASPMHERLASFEGDLRKTIADATEPVSRDAAKAITDTMLNRANPSAGELAAQRIVRAYYFDYQRYDQLTFPVLFATDIGDEASVVDVSRISPEDAPSIINERDTPRRKLAGNVVMNFGAFLERRWRWNDIMWGRLDGAERLISTLLPGDKGECPAVRQALINEAHGIILDEELRKDEAFDADGKFDWLPEVHQDAVGDLIRLPATAPLRERRRLQETTLGLFKQHYKIERSPDAERTMKSVARGTKIVGQMLDGMSVRYARLHDPAVWLTRLGSILWGAVQVAVPRSLAQMTASHWVKLCYAFAIVLLVLGIIVNEPVIRNFGATVLGVTFVMHLLVLMLRDVISRRRSWIVTAGVIVMTGIVTLAAFGAAALAVPAIRLAVVTQSAVAGGPLKLLRYSAFAIGMLVALWALIMIIAAGDTVLSWLVRRWTALRGKTK